MLNAHLSFCSNLPREVVESAQRNSLFLVWLWFWSSKFGPKVPPKVCPNFVQKFVVQISSKFPPNSVRIPFGSKSKFESKFASKR